MYRLLLTELPSATLISVGHRSTLHLKYHQLHLHINSDKSWDMMKHTETF